jgi:signal transduction histidine kinase
MLKGLDTDWVRAGTRRGIQYNALPHGRYNFVVRSEAPGAPVSEASFQFEILPYLYQTWWFRVLAAAVPLAGIWIAYRLRLRTIGRSFALVIGERARIAREIHDTLAQGYVGISSQLDAVAMCMPESESQARRNLDIARGMARHCLTEARRSVVDLRAPSLDGQDLAAALENSARLWTAGSGIDVSVSVSGETGALKPDTQQELLRIAQEAVVNAVKHSGAKRIQITLHAGEKQLILRISDDGRGFDADLALSIPGSHFGLTGMRERAERISGEMRLDGNSGEGAQVEIKAPLS